MSYRRILIGWTVLLLTSCGSATLQHPDGSAGNSGGSGGVAPNGGNGGATNRGGAGGAACASSAGGKSGAGGGTSGTGGGAGVGGTSGAGGVSSTGGTSSTGGGAGAGGTSGIGGMSGAGGTSSTGGKSGAGGGGTSGAGGGAGGCTPNAKQCSGQQPQVCDSTGTWQNSAAACGTCMTCSAATATCVAVTNGTTCNDGNACTQTDSCQGGVCTGSNPVSCPAPTACHTAGTCSSSTGACSAPNAPDNTVCTSNLNGSCQSGACGCYQGMSPVACTSGQSCLDWGFESGTAEGWGMDPLNPGLGVTNITISSSHFHTGAHSLAVTVGIGAYSNNGSRSIAVAVPLCASSGTVNLAGYTFSAWMYFTITNGSIPMNAANLIQGQFATTDSTVGETNNAIPVAQSDVNQWMHLQSSIVQADAKNYQVAINVEFALADPNSEGFSGTMYLDDIQITPP